MFSYPSNSLEDSRKLLSLLGSFWERLYGGKDLVERLLKGRGEVELQNLQNLDEAAKTYSRQEIPVFHTENWKLYRILESERGYLLPRYGDDGLEVGQGDLYFDTPILFQPASWEVLEGLVSAPLIFDRIADPTVTFVSGVDFKIVDDDPKTILFRSNPFENALLVPKPVFDGGEETDRELTLWIFRGNYDLEAVYRHWGYILGLSMTSSEDYLTLVNHLLDAMVSGTAAQQITGIYSLLTGIPLTVGNDEVVEEITEDLEHKLVITDSYVYRLSRDATVTVEEDDVLQAGDPLCDGLTVYNLGRGEFPADLRGLTLGKGFLVGDYYGDLLFENSDLTLTVTEEDGVIRVEFPLGGFPADHELFWDEVHAKGVAAGQTLGDLLRVSSTGPTEAANLPSTVNPLEFLVENVLRFNTAMIVVKVDSLQPEALGLSYSRLLRKILPPETALLVIIEMPVQEGSVILGEAGSSETPGAIESIGLFSGAEPISEELDVALVSDYSITAWPVAGN